MQGLIWIHFPHFFNHSTYALFFIEFNLYTFQQKLYVEFLLRDANILMSNLQVAFHNRNCINTEVNMGWQMYVIHSS